MRHMADYGASVGFDMSSRDWAQAYGSMDAFFSRGDVTEVDAVRWEGSGHRRPMFTRMAVDRSGAAVTVGLETVVPGFLSDGNEDLTFVAAIDGGERYGTLGQCFFDSEGLISFESDYEGESDSSALAVDIQRLDENSPTVSGISSIEAALQYVPLNLGAHLHISDPFKGAGRYEDPNQQVIQDLLPEGYAEGNKNSPPQLTSTVANLGFLSLAALFDAASVRVTRSQLQGAGFESIEEAEEIAGVECTELAELTGPEEEIVGRVVDATRHQNKGTEKEFWELILEFKDGKQLPCYAPHPFAPGTFESVEPYPVGAVVSGDVLFTGHFLPLQWGGSIGASRLKFPIAIHNEWLEEDGPSWVGAPSARNYPLYSGFNDFDSGFNFGRVITDIGGCLGFSVTNSRQALLTMMERPVQARWASASRIFDLFGDEGEYARATMSLVAEAGTMPESRRVLFGMSLPTLAWGAGICVDTRDESMGHYAAVDCQLYTDAAIEGTSFEELLVRGVGAGDREYGEAVVTATRVWMPEVHRNPFNDDRFLAVRGHIGREALIYLPCPDWLQDICDENGDDAAEVAYALQNLHGKVLVGRFDYCQVDYDGWNVELDRFDEEIYARIPESPLKRMDRRAVEDIEKSWMNPEVGLNSEAAFSVYASGRCTTADLMTALATGPNGLNVRRADIFDTRLVNLYEEEPDHWRVEWPEGKDAIMLMLDGPEPDELEGADDSDDFSGVRGAEPTPPRGSGASSRDPSVRDYLTQGDSFESHVEMVFVSIAEGRCLSILYGDRYDEPTARIIRPVRIVELGRPYVLAWDELREDWRTFRLDRFKMCSILERRFSPLEVPLPDDMTADNLERIRKSLRDDVDTATIRVAWSMGIGR